MKESTWPHDMQISVHAEDEHLLALLYIRHATDLAAETELPALHPLPAAAVAFQSLSLDWDFEWMRGLQRILALDAASTLEEMLHIGRLSGPDYRELMPPEFEAWVDQVRSRHDWLVRRGIDNEPERISQPALVSAWRRGLRCVVTIPVEGAYWKQLNSRSMLVGDGTREDPDLYGRALSTFQLT